MAELLKTYDGMGLFATRTECDSEGNSLKLGIDGQVDYLLDENGEQILDEHDEPIIGNAFSAGIKSIGNVPLFAAKSSIPAVVKAAAATVAVDNNSLNIITGTPPAVITLDCTTESGTIASFTAQLTAGSSDSKLVITVNGQPTLYNRDASNILEANKTYQVSCLNNCWTMAAFSVPV